MYHIGTSIFCVEATAPCKIHNGDKILNPVLIECTLKVQANQRLPASTSLDCPVKDCYSIGLKKLSNHLIQVHGIKNKAKRRKLMHKAKRVSTL